MILHTSTVRSFPYLIEPAKFLQVSTFTTRYHKSKNCRQNKCLSVLFFDLSHLTMSDGLATLCSAGSTGDALVDGVCALSEVSLFDLHTSVPIFGSFMPIFFSHWHSTFSHFVSVFFQSLQQVSTLASAETLDGVITGLDTFFLLFAVSLKCHFFFRKLVYLSLEERSNVQGSSFTGCCARIGTRPLLSLLKVFCWIVGVRWVSIS